MASATTPGNASTPIAASIERSCSASTSSIAGFSIWASYGYGLRPVRPLGRSALFILMGGLFFFLTASVARSKESHSGKKPLALRKREEKPEGNVSIYEAFLLSAT